MTDVLELTGGVLLVAAAAVWAAAVAIPLALAVAGAGLVTFSWLLTNPTAPGRALAALRAAVGRRRAARAAVRRAAARDAQEVTA
ncbi:hypothetical protein [Promicromonospora sp. NPDC050880]|uniref:hypothetical protein n=1 Tax=Promicromonospora sp. NPDC050880 TaxID=3364406 RepID=UPI00378F3770